MKDFNKTNMTMRKYISLGGLRTVLTVLLIAFGVGNAWAGGGGNSDYYSKVTLSKTGSGKVYCQKDGTSGSWTENTATSVADNQGSAPTHTWYIKAEADKGYAFTGWSSLSGWASNPNTSNNPSNGTITAGTSATEGKATATFSAVEVSAVSPTSKAFEPTDARANSTAYTQMVTFTTKYADEMEDFTSNTAVLSATTGAGSFTLVGTPAYGNNSVTATVKFVGGGKYAASVGGSRANTATLTLTSKGSSSQTKTCDLSATFPAASVKSGSAKELYPSTPTATVGTDVSFSVLYADGLGDFTLPTAFTSKSHTGDTWSIGTATGPNTNYETGVGTVVIPITFTSEGTDGPHTADITLGGVTVTVTAHVEGVANYDVKVIGSDGSTELGKVSWADARTLANANAGSTMVIARDIDLGSISAQEFTQNTTIDLNGKTITATLSAAGGLLKLNTAGKTLTITDSKTGGAINVSGTVNDNRISVVEILKGSLNLIKGDLSASNAGSGSTANTPYAAGVYLASSAWSNGRPTVTMAMSGGSVKGTRTYADGRSCYGIFCGGTGTNASSIDLTGGTVKSEYDNGTYSCGIYLAGKSTVSNMTLVSGSAKSCAYGIWIAEGSNVISGGTYTGSATTTYARAIITKGTLSIMNGTFTATAGTTNAAGIYTYGGTTTISNGTFTANAATSAYGIEMYSSGDVLKVNGGTFTATATTNDAAGAKVMNGTTLITTAGTFTGTMSGTTANAKAYGAIIASGGTATFAGTTFTGITSAASTISSTSDDQSKPYGAYGILSEGTLTLTNCNLSGQANKHYAYGLYTTTSLTMNGVKASATTTTADHASALYINGTGIEVTTTDGEFTATTGTKYGYGAYVLKGNLTANTTIFSADTKDNGSSAGANSYSRGIYHASGTTLTLNGCSLSAKGHESYSQNAFGLYCSGTATIDETDISATGVNTGYALYPSGSGATLTVNSGKFKGQTAALKVNSPKKVTLNGGFYSHNTNVATSYMPTGYDIFDVPSDMTEKGQGYNYRIDNESNPGYVVCKVYNSSKSLVNSYKTLQEALQYVNANSTTNYVIVMVADHVLPAGDYTLPSKATLVVPESVDRKEAQGTTPERVTALSTPSPSLFLTLTFASGANMTVNGTVETVAKMNSGAGGAAISGAPTGPYGLIHLRKGSSIIVNDGANLNCWGYISGKGEITAQKGASIREDFILGYWRGGTATSSMLDHASTWHAFPVMDYFYQCIEAPITYRPGAKGYGYSAVSTTTVFNINYDADDVLLVGTSNSMFLMTDADATDDTWVRKEYDPATDRVEWKLNSGAKLGNFHFSLAGKTIKSEDYYLPITNNMTITAVDGDITLTQDAILVPGAIMNINKTAKVKVADGKKLFVVDTDDWSKCGSYYYYKTKHSPSWTDPNTNPRTATKLPDAEIYVQGETEGSYYTSTKGANIHSTNTDAGKVKFVVAAGGNTTIKQITSTTINESDGTGMATVSFTTAQLKNEVQVNDSYYTSTVGTQAGYAYNYENQQWMCVLDGCLTFRHDAEGDHYYARPGAVVEVEENDNDAAYHDKATGTHYYIFTEKSMTADDATACVWWEAEPKEVNGQWYYVANNNKYDNYGTHYYYDGAAGYWKPWYVTITWKYEIDGTNKTAIYDKVPYGTQPKYSEFADPHKKNDALYSYAWTGWTDTNSEYYDNDDLPIATGNMTYTAHFESTRLQGYVYLKNEDGKNLVSGLMDAGVKPSYSGTPTKAATTENVYVFDGWSTSAGGAKAYEIDGLPNVTANSTVTYYAHYNTIARPYVITFANYNGDPLQESEFGYGSKPSYSGAEPTHANSGFWSYNFRGWRAPNGDEYDKNATLPTVSGTATYTALYTETDWTPEYTITFKDGDGKTLTTQYVRQGITPVYAGVTPTKTATVQYTYTFNNTWSPAIVAATADMTYTAQFNSSVNSYTITFADENNVVKETKSVAYGATPTYTGPSLAKAQDDEYTYTLVWSPAISSVTGDKTYKATYNKTKRSYTITWKDGDGNTITTTNVEYGVTPSYTGETPTKSSTAQYEYAFAGWFPALRAVTGNMTYQAQFSSSLQSYKITWLNWDGSKIDDTTVEYGIVPTHADVSKAATAEYTYTFSSWDPAPVAVIGNATYTATFSQTENKYAVSVAAGANGSVSPASVSNIGCETASGDITATANTGYQFTGWTLPQGVTPASGYAANSNPIRIHATAANKTITANFVAGTANYTVKHWKQNLNDDNYTEVTADQQTLQGTTATATAATAKNYTGFEAQTFSQETIAGDGSTVVNIYYNRLTYTITLHANEGTINSGNVTSYTYGTGATLPNDVTRKNHTFQGWYANSTFTGSAVTSISTTETGNKEFWAKWKVNNHDVTFNANGHGTAPATQSVPHGEKASEPTAPTATGYTFGGWYKEAVCTNAWKFSTDVVNDAVTLYAKWTPTPYTISYTLNGGSEITNPTSYTIESATITLNNPTRNGYTFAGWTGSNGETPEQSVTIAHGSTGNKTYTANWIRNYTITWKDGSDVIKSEEWAEGSTPSYNYQKEATAQYTFTLTGWSDGETVYAPDALPEVTGNAIYTAQLQDNVRSYTIRFMNDNGAELKSSTLQYGTTPTAPANPVSSNTDTRITKTFIGWSPSIVDVVGDATYTAQYQSEIIATENTSAPIVIDNPTEVVTTTVETTGKLDIQPSSSPSTTQTLTTHNLILKATVGTAESGTDDAASGEITGVEYINSENTNVYFDLTLNTWGRHWHAFGVPWKIGNLKTTKLVEIETKNGEACQTELILGRDYEIITYNGQKRANQGAGKQCWDYVADGDGTLTPGKAYMIAFVKPIGTIRFTKDPEAAMTNSDELDIPYYIGDANEKDFGWNAIANPNTYHANMDAGVQFCHVHNADTMKSDGFTTVPINDVKFVVGKAVYVQTPNDQKTTVAISHVGSSATSAPRRSEARSDVPKYYAIHIMANDKSADRIYIKADEDKEENVYTNGIDVAKMGISTVRAQMWIDRYNTQLAVNTIAPVNKSASYPLGISIPQAGEYTISNEQMANGDMLYLTYDNRVIWNLTYAPYTASFEKGTNSHYGLRLVRSNATNETTGVDQVSDGSNTLQIQKVIIDDKVYILRGGEIYTVTGQKAK